MTSQRNHPRLAPDLILTIEERPGEKYAVFLAGEFTATPPRQVGQGAARDLEGLLLGVRNSLEEIREGFGDQPNCKWSPQYAGTALKAMYTFGTKILSKIVDDAEKAWFKTFVAAKLRNARNPLRIEVRTPDQWPIPVELIPLSQEPSWDAPSTSDEVSAYARIFPAFSATIRHTFISAGRQHGSASLATDRRIKSDPEIALLFLWCFDAPCADRAHESIRAFGRLGRPKVAIHGPFPAHSAFRSTKLLADLLVAQGAAPPDTNGGRYYPIIHVHAHGETGLPNATHAHKLLFAYRKPWIWGSWLGAKEPVPVSDGDLDSSAFWSSFGSRSKSGPLMFINACGGAAPSHVGGLGLTGTFLSKGYRAVVGPQVAIPAPVAKYLAEHFYAHLFTNSSVGEALRKSRVELLEDYCNPLGALYTIHGESDLYVG